jgi:hypothetical protein
MVERKDLGGERRPTASQAGEVLGVGLQFAGAIILLLFLGRWLDERLGLLLFGVLVGAVGGFVSLYRQLVVAPRERERRRRESKTT